MSSAGLAALLEEELGLHVHPRSVERALSRRKKRGHGRAYEELLKTTRGIGRLRGPSLPGHRAVVPRHPAGLSLVLGSGLPAWVKAWAQPGEAAAVAPPAAAPSAPAVTMTGGPPTAQGVSAGTGGELVRLLAEMALGCWAKLVVAP